MATTHKVEIAFATDPDAVTPTWTDVTAFVWAAAGGSISINRGRADQLSTITPSQMTLTLDNHDGRFTAGYTGGAYYPNVVLGKRIRVSTNAGAGFVPRFDGYVNAWPVGWAPTGKYAEATITAVDRLARLGRQRSSDNLISTYYLQQSPTDYWMFADPEGTTVPYNRSGATRLEVGFRTFVPYPSPTVVYGAGTGPGYDGLTAMEMKGTTLGAVGTNSYTFSETQSLSVAGFFRSTAAAGSGGGFAPFVFWDGTNPAFLQFAFSSVGPQVITENSAGTTVTTTGSAAVYDGSTHHFAVVWQALGVGSGGTVLIYVDGVLDTSSAIPTAMLSGGITVPVGMVADDYGGIGTHTSAHYAIFPSALTAFQAQQLALSGLTAFAGESTNTRATRIGALAGVAVTVGGVGTLSMSPLLDVSNADYLSLLNATADTESGMLFVTPSGLVQMLGRLDQADLTAIWTLTAGQYDTDLQFLLDDFGVVNDVTADRPSGNPIHETNLASVAANGTYAAQKTLQTTSDLEVLDYVNWTLATGAPAVRCNQVTVNLLTQPTLVATWLLMELGKVLTLTGLPSTAPASSVRMQLQGYTETIALDSYSVQMNTSPYLLGNIFLLNDSTYGLLDGTSVLGY